MSQLAPLKLALTKYNNLKLQSHCHGTYLPAPLKKFYIEIYF